MIFKYNPEEEYLSDERCFINELHNTEEDSECSIARARVRPGVSTQLHALKGIVERYVIIQGAGLVEIGGTEPQAVSELDVVIIKADETQKITNIGQDDLVFICVCTPRFQEDFYRSLGR